MKVIQLRGLSIAPPNQLRDWAPGTFPGVGPFNDGCWGLAKFFFHCDNTPTLPFQFVLTLPLLPKVPTPPLATRTTAPQLSSLARQLTSLQ